MKKGFTLIELLAVIVILAIIALIAVPIILNIINSTKEESIERSEELYLSAVKNAIARKNLNEPNKEFNPTICKVNKDGNLSCTLGEEVVTLNIEVEGNRPCSGTIIIDNGKIESETVSFDCYYADNSGASIPDLMDTLTPVEYDEENKKWIIADPTSEWYNYDNGKWANAVILSKTGKNKKIGDELNIPVENNDFNSDVLAMFVWIPRYSYTIKNDYGVQLEGGSTPSKKTPGAIDIKFVGTNVKDNGSASYTDEASNWYTHPAFTFGSVELSGIWVGKFETSHTIYSSQTSSNQLKCVDENCIEADNLRILPNVQALRYNIISNFFYATRSMSRNGNIFGIDKDKTDTHMMKNSEWGAAAYMSQSIYGKYNDRNYTNVNKEIYMNNSSNYYTGRSSGVPSVDGYTNEGTCKYDDNGASRIEGTGPCGPGASTTGNITGIYDMSGGTCEYVMAVYGGIASSSGFSDEFFNDEKNSKYYNKYVSSNCASDECKGHALNETEGWYGDAIEYVSSSWQWVERGDDYNSGIDAGAFFFRNHNGDGARYYTFRVVLTSSS